MSVITVKQGPFLCADAPPPPVYLDRRQNHRQRNNVKTALLIHKDFGTLSAARFMRLMDVPVDVALRLLAGRR